MSIIGAIAEFFARPTASSGRGRGGAAPVPVAGRVAPRPGGWGKTPKTGMMPTVAALKELAMAAQVAVTTVGERADWLWQQSQQRDGQYLSQRGPAMRIMALAKMAQRIPVPQGASYYALVQFAAKFDNDYGSMVAGNGWAAYPNSDETDNMEGLQEIAAQLQADAMQLSAMAAQAAQRARQGGGHASRAPRVRKMARKIAIKGIVDAYGPNKAFEMLGEDIWDAFDSHY